MEHGSLLISLGWDPRWTIRLQVPCPSSWSRISSVTPRTRTRWRDTPRSSQPSSLSDSNLRSPAARSATARYGTLRAATRPRTADRTVVFAVHRPVHRKGVHHVPGSAGPSSRTQGPCDPDRHPVHRSKAVTAWLAENAHRVELHRMPGYSPQLNPDEILNADVKRHVHAASARSTDDLARETRRFLHRRQRQPDTVRGYFRAPHVRYTSLEETQ
ncbi:transposase [Nocardia abscessus]|uniref:transposase n=1 Tax=Nocardia abscessus TaxID=120957 RepID=UPI0024545E56|nr:transposase [Nocardia abscessus]